MTSRANKAFQAVTSFINPVTGIIALVVVVICALAIYAASITQTLGRNSNACKNGEDCSIAKAVAPDCTGSIGSFTDVDYAGGAWPTPGSSAAIEATYSLLLKAGLSEPDAYLMTAIAGLESNWNPRPPGQSASSSYAGLFQMGVAEASTNGGYSAADRLDPAKAIDMAAKYYQRSGGQPWAGWPGSTLSDPSGPYGGSNPRGIIITKWKSTIAPKVQQVLGGPGFKYGLASQYGGAWGVEGVAGDPPYGAGGGAIGATGGDQCGGANALGGDIVTLAQQIAWPDGRKVNSDGGTGRAASTEAYRQAKGQLASQGLGDGYLAGNLFASCDRFVATVMRLTVDQQYPWGPTSAQAAYLASSPKWARRTGALQGGDVLIVGGSGGSGHTLIYLGGGRVAQASYFSYTATQSNENWPASPGGTYRVSWDYRTYYAYYFKG